MMEKDDNKLLNNAVDEELLRDFFAHSSRLQIADNGFSDGVMRRIHNKVPLRQRVAYGLWSALCLAGCIVVFLVSDGMALISRALQCAFGSMAALFSAQIAKINFGALVPHAGFSTDFFLTPLLFVGMLCVLGCVGLYSLAESE